MYCGGSQNRRSTLYTNQRNKHSVSVLNCNILTNVNTTENHYENTPIQIYWKVYHQKNENFQIKNSDIFLISAQNIDCGYSLEPPQRGGSKEYSQSMFWA